MREDQAANAMLDAVQRLIEAQIAITPELRAPLLMRLRSLFPDLAPPVAPAVAPLDADQLWQILAGLNVGNSRRWSETEHQTRQHAKGLLLARMKPATRAKGKAA